eukprot:694156-Rhodomonas_salina.1
MSPPSSLTPLLPCHTSLTPPHSCLTPQAWPGGPSSLTPGPSPLTAYTCRERDTPASIEATRNQRKYEHQSTGS